MSTGSVDVVHLTIRHRPKGETSVPAVAVDVEAATPGDAIDMVRAALPEGQVMTSIVAR